MPTDWNIYAWFCPNCKGQVAGFKNSKNQIKAICNNCGAEMVRTIIGRKHDIIDLYAPNGQKHPELKVQQY